MSADRFGIAQDPRPVSLDHLQSQRDIRDAIQEAAEVIIGETEPSREQSLALTKLEEALMWAGKAVFQ